MRRRRFCLGLGLMAGLSGCATRQPISTATATASPDAEPGTESRASWSGRLAVTVQQETPQHFSAAFELIGAAEAGEIRLTSPLGQLIGLARWSPQGAELLRGSERQNYPNMHELTLALTGSALPLAPLFQWLRGHPIEQEGWHADLSRLADGRLSAQRLQPHPPVQLRIVLH